MKYWAPTNAVDPDAAYWNGDRAEGIVGAKPPAQAIEHPMREITAAITGDGQTPTQGALDQLGKAIPGMADLVVLLATMHVEVMTLKVRVAQLEGLTVGGLDPDGW